MRAKTFAMCIGLILQGSLFGQNTIGGVKTIVPEEEVKRQSAFLNAEKEWLLGHWDKALEAYKAFVFDNPTYDAAWYGLSRTYLAKGDMANAMDAIEKAIALAPDNHWYLLYQADLFEKNARNRDALAAYELLAKRFPDKAEFYEKIAYLAVLIEDPKRALKALDKVTEIQGLNEANTAKIHLIYVGMGDNKKAAEAYKKLADAYPNNARYRYQLADFYERIGDKAAARKVWEDVAVRFPGDPLARLALAAAQPSGSDAQYLVSIRPLIADPKVSVDAKVKELAPFLAKVESGKSPDITQNMVELGALLEKTHPDEAKAWSLSGDILYLANRSAEALEKYQRCIQLNPGVFSVWDNTLSILREQKNYKETQKVAEQAMDAFPNQPRAYLHYAAASVELRQYDDALNQLNQALLMVGNNTALRAELLEIQGDAFMGKGDKMKAKESWQKAYELSKNPALTDKINRVQ